MRAANLLGCLLLGRWNVSAFEVELNELLNPSVAAVRDDNSFKDQDQSCAPRVCGGILTGDGSRDAGSRFGCTQPEPGSHSNTVCKVTYRLNEEEHSGGPKRNISSVHVAFTADSETSLQVAVGDEETVTWTGEKGSTGLQEIQGVAGYFGDELKLFDVMSEGSYIGITEVEIYVEVDDVPVTGISASERMNVTASATVNSDAAMDTLDGSTGISSSGFCSVGDVCEITYDLLEVSVYGASPHCCFAGNDYVRGVLRNIGIMFTPPAFVEHSSTAGLEFNLYIAGADGVFSSVLSGVTAGPRNASIMGLQTFGGVRALARYVKIEGVPGSGGEFVISKDPVDIRLNEDAPTYPITVDSSWVPVGRLPLGNNVDDYVQHDPRPASEGGCSAGPFQGCGIYNIKDGDKSPDSRWSCSPKVGKGTEGGCIARFSLNSYKYIRQIQLERHPVGHFFWRYHDFQTWDISACTNQIVLQPKFRSAADWMSINKMALLEEEQSSDSTPILDFDKDGPGSSSVLPILDTIPTFSFDLANADNQGNIRVGMGDQAAKVRALKMKFPSNKSFTFDIGHYDGDFILQSTRFTSTGGDEEWETFVLPEAFILNKVLVVAVEGPDQEEGYPTLRVNDCQVIWEVYSPGSKRVASTAIAKWEGIPDYIGDGNGDQEIMIAICDWIGEDFDGVDCDGVATGNEKDLKVNLDLGDVYLDGPVFLKSGVVLRGDITSERGVTEFIMHGSGTGTDAVINAIGVSGAFDITIDILFSSGSGCPLARARFVDTESVWVTEFRGSVDGEGPEVTIEGVTGFNLAESAILGATIKDSVNVLFEVGRDNGDPVGSIGVPGGGDQSANLVVSGTTPGATLKGFSIASGAEPRIVLENANPFTIDEVTFPGGTAGDCIITIPQGSDGDSVLIQLNVETELVLEDECFVLA